MQSNSSISVVLASDDLYAPYMGVAALSVVANTHAPDAFAFHILDAGISEANRARVAELLTARGASVSFIRPDLEQFLGFPIRRYGVGTYLRLAVSDLLPTSVSRAFYLDCDVLVFDDLAVLWDTPLDGKAVAAVANLGHQPVASMGIPEGDYFNAGVLLMDLDAWRRFGASARLLDYMRAHGERLAYLDQDALNAVFRNNWKPLPLRWNQQPATYSMVRKFSRTDPRVAEFEEAVANPGIVHFLGKNKPWQYMTFHPLKEFFWHYLEQTPWRTLSSQGRTPFAVIRKSLMLDKHLKRWRRRRQGPRPG